MSDLEELFYGIKDLNYVVQRNFENLPGTYVVGEHEDLDLFCSDKDKIQLISIVSEYTKIPVDVRSENDKYYPVTIGQMLLDKRDMI